MMEIEMNYEHMKMDLGVEVGEEIRAGGLMDNINACVEET